MPSPKNTISTIIPTMRYNDAKAAIDWLCDTFGFTRHLIVEDDDGGIAHAQLSFGNGMIMLGSARDDEFGRLQQPPTTDAVTQSPYIIVSDIDEHYARAIAAGATITVEIKNEDYGGRVYSCRDPQGQLWNFGNYDPERGPFRPWLFQVAKYVLLDAFRRLRPGGAGPARSVPCRRAAPRRPFLSCAAPRPPRCRRRSRPAPSCTPSCRRRCARAVPSPLMH